LVFKCHSYFVFDLSFHKDKTIQHLSFIIWQIDWIVNPEFKMNSETETETESFFF